MQQSLRTLFLGISPPVIGMVTISISIALTGAWIKWRHLGAMLRPCSVIPFIFFPGVSWPWPHRGV